MTANGLGSDWTTEVIAYLSRNLPAINDDRGCWQDMAMTAYQVGCEALVALGQAEETQWGALPLKNPRLPDILPRWDDICVAILYLAGQQGKITYRLQDGSVPPPTGLAILVRPNAPPPPAPNIAAAHGLGPAIADKDTSSVLRALRLVVQGRWTSGAETVLWRKQPREWGMDVRSDPRFAAAVRQACNTIPDDVRAEMNGIVKITDADVAAAVAQSAAWHEEARAKHGPNARISPPDTAERARSGLRFVRRGHLDWLFFRRWRLADGWLTPKEAKRALEIFHDPLAIAMRRAVIAQVYPDLPVFAEH